MELTVNTNKRILDESENSTIVSTNKKIKRVISLPNSSVAQTQDINVKVNDLLQHEKFVSPKEMFAPKNLFRTSHSSTPQSEISPSMDSSSNQQLRRVGERFIYEFLKKMHPNAHVEWVNQNDKESGYPYDIIFTLNGVLQYIEVKATNMPRMAWFNLTKKEYEFMMEKKDQYLFYLVSVKTGHWTKIEQAHLKFGNIQFTHNQSEENNNMYQIEPNSYRVEFTGSDSLDQSEIIES